MKYTLSIIIPVFNEEKTIIQILEKVKAVELISGGSKQLILIDDNSTDTSEEKITGFINENLSRI